MTDLTLGHSPVHAALDFFDDQHPPAGDFLRDVLTGLAATPKSIPPVYFYDAAGSALFDQIGPSWPCSTGSDPSWPGAPGRVRWSSNQARARV